MYNINTYIYMYNIPYWLFPIVCRGTRGLEAYRTPGVRPRSRWAHSIKQAKIAKRMRSLDLDRHYTQILCTLEKEVEWVSNGDSMGQTKGTFDYHLFY